MSQISLIGLCIIFGTLSFNLAFNYFYIPEQIKREDAEIRSAVILLLTVSIISIIIKYLR